MSPRHAYTPAHGIPILLPFPSNSGILTPSPSDFNTPTNSARPSTEQESKPRFSIKETLRRKKTYTYHPAATTSLSTHPPKPWTPPALRVPTLLLAIAISIALLATLQHLLHRSQTHNGVIFAPDVNDLPLSRTFLYQYFPTIVAVFYSIFWSWIDLETKRVEPWYRLSRGEGCEGRDGLLLSYPFSFVPLAPFRALRDRHWPVFFAAFALVLVAWGLVPVQAGIFSVHRIEQATALAFDVSTSNMPIAGQPTKMTFRFAQSTYGIATLNETLPGYMALNYTLAPFKPSVEDTEGEARGNWTAATTLYSLDMHCEQSFRQNGSFYSTVYNSTWGCSFPVGPDGNDTMAPEPITDPNAIKDYSALYAGCQNEGYATYYIDYCPPDRQSTFFGSFTRNKKREEDPPNDPTAVFCEPRYYEQEVNATVDASSRSPLKIVPLGPKRSLSDGVFNTTWLEGLLNGGSQRVDMRSDIPPTESIPLYIQQLSDSKVTIGIDSYAMKALAMIMEGRPEEDYLDWKVLGASYTKAYQILFARAMADVLGTDFAYNTSKQVAGRNDLDMDAVTLEPVFVYVVEGLLAAVILSTMALLYLSMKRKTALASDPSTIASIMSLVAEEKALLADFKDLDCCTDDELRKSVQDEQFKLLTEGGKISIVNISSPADPNMLHARQRTSSSKAIDKPIRPKEFNLWMSIPFVGLFLALGIILAIIYCKARNNGLPLPSKNKLVQNIVENYIPTALATLIEPMWVLVNRLLCLLRPIESLQKGGAKAEESIELNYSSLPPQLVVFKALRARHFVLAAVCTMALLSNLLAVSFAGIFFHATVEVLSPSVFQPPFDLKFVPINGSIGPISGRYLGTLGSSGAYRGGTGDDQFLAAESNYTRGTALPAWTDDNFFYLPIASTNTEPQDVYEAETTTLGAELDCSELMSGTYQSRNITTDEYGLHEALHAIVTKGNASASCIATDPLTIKPGPDTEIVMEYACQKGPAAAELVYRMEATNGKNASQTEQDICWSTVVLGWLRNATGSCGMEVSTPVDLSQSFFIQCRPRLVKGHATVRVDGGGRLLAPSRNHTLERNIRKDELEKMFDDGPLDFIRQSNMYLFQFREGIWHGDSYASDFINYFVRRISSNRLLDPKTSLPTLDDVQAPLSEAYSRLFAIWLGTNKEHLLVSRENANTMAVRGWRVEKEERLFLTTALFAIALGILSIYVVVAAVVYIRRPGQYLPRLPTSIASMIGLFAASAAVHDMQGTSTVAPKERARHLRNLDSRYGYGNYVGVDGGIHVGIEKMPFVRPRHATMRKESILAFRKAAA